MTALFADSFDHYTTNAAMILKWTTTENGAYAPTAVGRNGTNGIAISGNLGIRKTLPGGSKATLIMGASVKINTAFDTSAYLFAFRDGTSSQVELWTTAGGLLQVKNGSGTVLATGTTVLGLGTPNYIELKVTVNNTTGVYAVQLNGAAEVSGSSADTQNTANATADGIRVNYGGANLINVDDLYVCDNAGTTNNDFLGDVRVQCIFPDGAGGVTQWTPSAGSNYQNVDETTPNDDTDYNSDSTVGDRDTYTLSNLSPSTANIKFLQIIPYVRKDDAGTRTVAPVYRIGGVNYDQANLPNLTTSYQYLPQIAELSPATTSAWTLSEVNGLEAGLKVIA